MASGTGALGGAASGAAFGSNFGPWGTGIGAGLGALFGLFGGGGKDAKPASPELERLYALEQNRFDQSNPLVEAAYRLAFNRLPTAARAGFDEPSYATANAQVPYPTSGDYNEPLSVRNALRSAEVRMRMADPIIQAIQRLAMSRMPMSVQARPAAPRGWTSPGRDDIPPGDRGPEGPGRRV